jgi:TolB protein
MGTARAPVFSPEGTKLAFLAIIPGKIGFELWVVDVEAGKESLLVGEPRQLTAAMKLDADSGLSWVK